MADFVSLTCPPCNGKLRIGKDLDRFACGYCGTEFVVNRGGGDFPLAGGGGAEARRAGC